MHPTDNTRAATDVGEFISDLDGGQLEHMLSVALSETAAAVVDREKKGKVKLELTLEHIKGTHQVRIEHKVVFERPTMTGAVREESTGASVLHVGKRGALSLAQPKLFDDNQAAQSRIPGTN